MKFGLIGAGPIGTNISKKLVENGHEVKVADVRNIERLEGKAFAGTAVEIEDVTKNIDILILSLPLHVIPALRDILADVSKETIIVDTSNYYPFRDKQIEDIENGMPESIWVTTQLNQPIIKAFNNLLAHTLEYKGTAEHHPGRIAMTVAGNNQAHKDVIINLSNELGFDAVDTGSLEESWRQQPGTPAYCTELTKEKLISALEKADKEKAPLLRDKVFEKMPENPAHEDIVNINREVYNS